MCGIVGFLGHDLPLLERMLQTIVHRGPDSSGTGQDGSFSMGMRRLSIVDLRGGDQPITSPLSGSKIVFNGELYNSPELRSRLESCGHRFVTDHSDTETVLRAYDQWGDRCLEHLVGMFAFAIYDPRQDRMFLARDRLGIKPLYYYSSGPKFLFASEIKAILQDDTVARAPNQATLARFLLYRVHDDRDDTFFSGIKRLAPGHYMWVGPTGELSTTRYWDPEITDRFSSEKSDDDYAQEFAELLQKVLARHLISDVPLGVSLSGGLDSSGVASITQSLIRSGTDVHTTGGLHTFSALYPGQSIDESAYIGEVERYVQSSPHYAYPKVDEFWNEIDTWVWFQEEPTISSAPYAYYSVYRIAKGQVKVVLSGNGGDELLAGYIPYFKAYLTSGIDQHHYLAIARELLDGRDLYVKYLAQYARQRLLPDNKKVTVSSMVNLPANLDSDFVFTPDRNLNRRLAQDVLAYSTPNLLRYEDKNSMAFSIESRVPFLDHELVEYIFSLPIDQKIKHGWNRYVYRNAMRDKMPELNRTRRSKIGFTNPEMEWMKTRSREIREIFLSSTFAERGIFNQRSVVDQFDLWTKGAPGDGLAFWRVLISELWMRRYIDSPIKL